MRWIRCEFRDRLGCKVTSLHFVSLTEYYYFVASVKRFRFCDLHLGQLRLGLCLIGSFGSAFSGVSLFTDDVLCLHPPIPDNRIFFHVFIIQSDTFI